MPNWCSNKLTLRHKQPERVHAAIDAFKEGKFLEHFVPLPEGQWNYDFCVSNWGTKWDVSGDDRDMVLEGLQVSFYFDSAWSPPTEAYRAMAAQGFEVEALYNEPGMCFVGKIIADEDGFDDDYYEYGSEDSNTVRDLIGEELDDYYGISEFMEQMEMERLEDELDEIINEENGDE